MFKNISFKIDGVFVLVVAVLLSMIYFYVERKKIEKAITVTIDEKLNVTHENNIINVAVQDVVGKEKVQGFFNRTFATFDLLNPFNKSDAYAKTVLGLPQ